MSSASNPLGSKSSKLRLLVIHDSSSLTPIDSFVSVLAENQQQVQSLVLKNRLDFEQFLADLPTLLAGSKSFPAQQSSLTDALIKNAVAFEGNNAGEAAFVPDIVAIADSMQWGKYLEIAREVGKTLPDVPLLLLATPQSNNEHRLWTSALAAGFSECVISTPSQLEDFHTALERVWNRGQPFRELSQQERDTRQLADQLRRENRDLEQQIVERTEVAERRANQLRILAGELTKAEERERRRLAQMLHDDLQQMLVAARMHISAIPDAASPSRIAEAVDHVDDLLDRSIRLSRNLTVRFSPPILYDAGLAPALEWLGRQVEEEHGMHVEVDCDDTAQPEALDTRVLLFQAVRELLFNVVKHAGVPKAKVTMYHAGESDIQVSVCDEGKGFDPDVLASADSLHSGFGLFSIRERLELIRGRMEIESITGEGACVRLFAPLELTDEERMGSQNVQNTLLAIDREKEPTPPKLSEVEPIRVLLADDHRIMRASLAGLLRTQAGIDVIGQAADGQEVIDMARSLRPDVIVMDITMPVVDGVEATRTLTRELPNVSVIGLSMHEKEDMQTSMREAGAARYLTKDGPPELLIAAIRSSARAMNRRRQ